MTWLERSPSLYLSLSLQVYVPRRLRPQQTASICALVLAMHCRGNCPGVERQEAGALRTQLGRLQSVKGLRLQGYAMWLKCEIGNQVPQTSCVTVRNFSLVTQSSFKFHSPLLLEQAWLADQAQSHRDPGGEGRAPGEGREGETRSSTGHRPHFCRRRRHKARADRGVAWIGGAAVSQSSAPPSFGFRIFRRPEGARRESRHLQAWKAEPEMASHREEGCWGMAL